MKATGIVRNIDDIGRVVIPRELRRTLKIRENDPIEIFTDDEEQIILRKHRVRCDCCGSTDESRHIRLQDGVICTDCVKELTLRGRQHEPA